jgi:hypothetical protein
METRDPEGATSNINQELSQRRGWLLVIAVGFGLYLLSIVLGLQPVGPLCGSPLLPQSRAAEISDLELGTSGLAAECYRSIDSASVPVWIIMALGVGLVLTGVAVRIVGIRRFIARSGS